MKTRNDNSIDPMQRAKVLTGVAVAMATLIGVSAPLSAGWRPHKGAAIVARVIAPASDALLETAPLFFCAAGALLALIWLARQARAVQGESPMPARVVIPIGRRANRLPRKNSISYHIGGLHGP